MSKESPNITNIIRSLGSGKKAQASTLITEIGLNNAAVITKLRKPNALQQGFRNDKESANFINQAEIKRVSDFIGKRKKDSENIAKLFPDVELAKQIYISSVIAPKDMTSTELLYETEDSVFPAEVVTTVNEAVKDIVENIYKIDEEFSDILRESLFETGSYVVATLPESTIDEVINGDRNYSLESASPLIDQDTKSIKSLGFLSDSVSESIALESFFTKDFTTRKLSTNKISDGSEDLKVEVFDNFELLKYPKLVERASQEMASSIIKSGVRYRRAALESSDAISIVSNTAADKKGFTSEQIKSSIFKTSTSGNTPILTLKTKENAARKSIGRALRMKIPSEAVIPVYPPGQPDTHVGYFVALNQDGAPVTVDDNKGYADGITGLMNTNLAQNQSTGLNGYLLKKAKDTIVGNDNVPTITDMARVYSSIIEKQLVDKLKNGIYKKNLEIGNNEDIYRMMMYRALAGNVTRLLYVPSDLITYYAYRYHPNGTGKSMLDDLTMLISTRAVVMVSRVMQQIRSSINSTNVQVTLDPKDPDQEKTMEMTVANVMKFLQFQMPVGLVTQADIYEWVARAGVRFTFDNHPGLPELKYDFSNDTIGNTIPDTDLDEDLRRRTYMAFGLSPEQVDNSLSPDFATSVVANNALLSKRVLQTQQVYCNLLTNDVRKVLKYDVEAYTSIKDIIRENLALIKKRIKDHDNIDETTVDDEDLVVELTDRYIDSVLISLPKPDLTTIENQQEALEKAEGLIDKILESYISTEAFPEMVSGDANGKIDEYKGIVKAALMRQWLADNPSFKDFNDIINRALDKEGKTTIFDITDMHIKGFVGSMLKFMKNSKPFADAASRDVDNIENGEQNENPDSGNDDPVGGSSDTDTIDDTQGGEETQGEQGQKKQDFDF